MRSRAKRRAGSLMVPPERCFTSTQCRQRTARYLALKPFSSRKFPGLRKQWGTSESVKLGGDQIEYETKIRASAGCSKKSWLNAGYGVRWAPLQSRKLAGAFRHREKA